MQAAPVVQNMGEAIRASLAGGLAVLVAIVPRLIAFLVILAIGWFIASLLAKAVAALLHAVKFDDLSERSGFSGFVNRMGAQTTASGLLAGLTKWFVRLIVLVVAFDALGLPAISAIFRQLVFWLPNLVVALVVLVIGGLLARAGSNLVRGATAEADVGNPNVFATITSVAIWAFAIVVAVNQLGIATGLIDILLTGVVGAAALAAGLAFGLGGRDKASQALQRWGRKVGGGTGPTLQPAGDASMTTPGDHVWRQRSVQDRRASGRP